MGLDISAYRQLRKVDCVFDADGEPIDPVSREPIDYAMRAYVNNDFPGREEGIEDRAIYVSEHEGHSFRAGSYGWYNRWRDELAQLAGYQQGSYEQYDRNWDSYAATVWQGAIGPFSELINFSDCEGVIGPVVSAKLAKDFAAFDERAAAVGGQFYEKYQEWRKAFDMAADGGAVSFH